MKSPLERFKTLAEEQKKSLRNSERKNDDQKLTSQQKDLSEKEASKILLEGDNYLPISNKIQTPVPNIVLRSALFGLVEKGDRKFEKNVHG
ncbi:hypothetical protein [Arsenophonus nasoniae]|uniref:Uncharacterized protein n=1 Tax=Arsenophonus nasoniae TaxID=638 RepID=A0AA95GR95_9GAMM|nr:hypothetical protein [Arsenophonus nasoniae]WGM03447.1 hypothetical protein QE210_18150 [Arsenophonus nasoniae]